jgi:hypothetical protein
MSTAPTAGALRRTLQAPGGFATVVELVPWAGALADARGAKPLKAAADLAGDDRITALSITDNAGGLAKLPSDLLGEQAAHFGHDVIVHVACRDRNRNGMPRPEPAAGGQPGGDGELRAGELGEQVGKGHLPVGHLGHQAHEVALDAKERARLHEWSPLKGCVATPGARPDRRAVWRHRPDRIPLGVLPSPA